MSETEEYSVPVMEDNQGTTGVKLFNNPFSRKKVGHIYVKHPFIRDAVLAERSRAVHVASENQHADELTKALERNKFEKHVNFLMNVG